MKRFIVAALALLCACATPRDLTAFPEQRMEDFAIVLDDGLSHYPVEWREEIPITAICRDGWFSYTKSRRGACGGHGGVHEWVNRPAE